MADRRADVRRLLDAAPAGAATPRLALLDFDVTMRVPDAALAAYLTDLYAPLVTTGEAEHVLTLAPTTAGGFSVHLDATRLLTTPARSIAFASLLWHANREAIEATRSQVLVHASAVALDGRAVVLPGPMGAGKSTLAAALTRAGLEYVTDEVVAVDPASGTLRPYPKYLSIDAPPPGTTGPGPAVRTFVGDQVLVAPDALRAGSVAHAPPVPRLVVAPTYVPAASVAVEPIAPAEAVVTLAQHAFHLAVDAPRTLEVLAALVDGAACFRLVSGTVDDAVGAVLGLLEDVPDPVRA